MSTLRRIQALDLAGRVTPGTALGELPRVELAAPTDLYVDESYQRSLSRRSVVLIERLVAKWDWRAYKPPTVVRDDGLLHVIDGQHTAIAAASRPDLGRIPVLVVDGVSLADRARAFVGINFDRITVSPLQIHHAMAVAGDEDALTLNQVCERAGARIVRTVVQAGTYKPGDIAAIAALRGLVKRRHAMGARRVIEIGVKAHIAPIGRSSILAIEALLFDERFGKPDAGDVVTWLRAPHTMRRAEQLAAERDIWVWEAIAQVVSGLIGKGASGGRTRQT